MRNQQKKTLRHFQCRDFLWEIFEQMSAELECSIDYLVNEAMRQYARSRNYGPRTSSMSISPGPAEGHPAQPPRPAAPAAAAPPAEAVQPRVPAAAAPPLAPRPRSATPPPLRPSSSGMPAVAPPAQRARAGPSMAPPPLPGPAGARAARTSPAPGPVLHVIFAGQKMPILKDPFVIGRGSKSSDLAIKDGNISRKHALVTRHEGTFYLKDLGSTNGVIWNGRRIESKRIEEGDVFMICDYELRFTYR